MTVVEGAVKPALKDTAEATRSRVSDVPPSSRARRPPPEEAQRIIDHLHLQPHPEGGYYRETFVDRQGSARAHSTAIFYLLHQQERSSLHRIDSAEVWHFYRGGPCRVVEVEAASVKLTTLGDDILAGQKVQHVVPAGVWFGAYPLDPLHYCLMGCTVAPGFQFSGFELGDRRQLLEQYPHAKAWIEFLT